ncbi:DNA-protecting protein DprA [Flavobacterium sp. SM15]|uniref:DNA-processing protein DprA n=1 Tax=Flavobacterium sp. SM15 TaxID=2908005 RepID=UPI001EDA8126|nr:DNA-processing protein DprA [Flavobacterium sp. SM15]MCG2611490.1 DNA-protecting protein DprA [Flavobacterium sp. SM15]
MKLELKEIILLKYITNYNIKVIKAYADVNNTFEELLHSMIQTHLLTEKDILDAYSQTDLALEKLEYYNVKTITFYDDDYPESLKRINDSPLVIYYKGILKLDKLSAVVGSRKVSKFAKKITYEIVDWFNELEYGIVSGLALGIDTYAHEKAVQNKQYTMAVLPNALDTIYPTSNYKLANDILNSGGCLVSELIFGVNRGNKSFVQRNRLQSAFSDIVVPIEMGVDSGTMHTIDFAKRYHKKIGLFKPTPMLSELEQYSGITYLINKPHSLQSIFSDKDSFIEMMNKLNSKEQLNFDL